MSLLVLTLILIGSIVLILLFVSPQYQYRNRGDVDDSTNRRKVRYDLKSLLLTLRRKDLFTKSLLEKEEKVKQPVKGIDYDRYGSYIPDPDVSHYDYKKLREKDRTLPVNDPRTTGVQSEYGFSLNPLQKWLYFSD